MLHDDMRRIHNNWLIADIGATTTRCAVCTKDDKADVTSFQNDRQHGVVEILRDYLDGLADRPAACALAVAAPIEGETVTMINRDWSFSRESVLELGMERVEIVNDFHAIAFALPFFTDETRVEIGRATAYRQGNIAVLGPGSGLGMSAWISGKAAMCGEGGHISLVGRNDREDRIIARLRERYGHVSAERVLSGPGLVALHEAMHDEAVAGSEEITADPESARNRATLEQFFLFLGSTAAELALITGAYGGVYIAGGIVPANMDAIQASGFRDRFEDKNRYRDYMRAIPTWVITDPYPGLTGLRAYIQSSRESQSAPGKSNVIARSGATKQP